MSEPTLPSGEALLLFGLLARHGECPQAELLPKVKKADRDALVRARLISSAKVGRGLYLKLEDAGWAWAAEHLSAELPPAQRTLKDMLTRLGEYLARSGTTLADVIGVKPEPVTPPKPPAKVSKPRSDKPEGKSPTAPVAADARAMILLAYSEITGGRTGTDVRLADLRARLPHLDRAAFDAALTQMHLESGKARLMRIENTRAETDADRDAALHFKGNVFHVLWVQS
jgi:hypothetical protein